MAGGATREKPAIAGGEPAKRTPYGSEKRYGEEEIRQLREALEQGTLFYHYGKKVFALEAAFAEKNGVRHAVACSSGTAGIHAACIALGISPGDEVIVSPITDMGGVAPILYQGAVPVFADVTPHGYVLDAGSVAGHVTGRTRAVIAAHLGGNACDLQALGAVCGSHGIALIEDCAQAFGCRLSDRPIGTTGSVGCFSLNEFKHISCGDGGIVVTGDPEVGRRLRLATDKGYDRHGAAAERDPRLLANNYRMTELQAAVALAQLEKLDGIVARRRRWCEGLSERLRGAPGIQPPQPTAGCECSWWFYLLRVQPEVLKIDADAFAAALGAEGIRAGAHYIGRPVYAYPVFANHSAYARGEHPYRNRDYTRESCPVAEEILRTCVVLPVNQAFTETDLDEVSRGVWNVAAWFTGGHRA